MTRCKTLRECLKTGLAFAVFPAFFTSLAVGAFWDPAWRRIPFSPDELYPLIAALAAFPVGFVVELRRMRKGKQNSAPPK